MKFKKKIEITKEKIDTFVETHIKLNAMENEIWKHINYIVRKIETKDIHTINSVDKNMVEYSYFWCNDIESGCFPTKLLYMDEQQLDDWFIEQKKKKERNEKARIKREQKEKYEKDLTEYKRLKKKYGKTN